MIIKNNGLFQDDGTTPFSVAAVDQTARDSVTALQAQVDALTALVQALGITVSPSGVRVIDNSGSSVIHTLLSEGRIMEQGADENNNFYGRILMP